MGLFELIIVVILINNGFSFWQILGILIIFLPIFYIFIFPFIVYIFSGGFLKKKNKVKNTNVYQGGLDTFIQDGIKSGDFSIKKEDDILIDDEFSSLIGVLTFKIREKDYSGILNIDKEVGWKLLDTIKDGELRDKYVILVGATYQELGDIKKANIYFDDYLYRLTFTKEQLLKFKSDGMSSSSMKLLYLIKELDNLGLSYKFDNKEYKK